jgi:hypothetical protein
MTDTKSLTVFELLADNIPNGQKAKVTTDNELYGVTVIKQENMLINCRTGQPLPLTAEVLRTRFKPIQTETKVSLSEFLEAYQAGKKLKVVVGERCRYIQKPTKESLDSFQGIMDMLPVPVKALTPNDFLSFDELIEGKFYVVE